MDEVLCLEYGADDYIRKPLNLLVVKARINAALRRVRMQSDAFAPLPKAKEITLIAATRCLQVDGKVSRLSPKEFKLMQVLMERAGEVVKREELLKTVWGISHDARVLDENISRLRQRIEPSPAVPRHIITERGIGYCYISPDMA